MEGYDNADGKKKYVNNYFKNLYIINGDRNSKEIERLKVEIGKTFNFIMDMQSNELYFSNSELQLVKKNLDKIEEYFKEEKYVKAAILLVSLQAVMGYQTDLVEVLYLMKENNLSFSQCLKTKVINKYKFDEMDRINNDNVKNNNLRPRSYINIHGDHYMQYAFIKKYYNEKSYLRKLTIEYKKLLAAIEESPKKDDYKVILVVDDICNLMHRLYNCENDQKYYFDNKNIIRATFLIIGLGKSLGIDVDLPENIINNKSHDMNDYVADSNNDIINDAESIDKKDSESDDYLKDKYDLYSKETKKRKY